MFFNWVFGFSQSIPDTYFESKYGKLEYGLFVPKNYTTNEVYPLVMYLHGWGNNYTVYLNWYNDEIQTKTPCFVYTPKTPTTWADWSGWNDISLSEPMVAAMHVLDSLKNVYPIDTNRLYVYGISMGGEGVFDLFHKLPNKFAAGISICGGGQEWWAENISNTPLWMFHGSDDQINPPEITERVYRRLQQIGATRMRYTNYPGYGHEIWDRAQRESSFYDWMFSFSKNDTTCGKPYFSIHLEASVSNNIDLSWNDIRNETDKCNKIWYYTIYNSSGILATTGYNKTNYQFTPELPTDTFKVIAVNYCFKASEFSNLLYFKENTVTNASDIKTNKERLRNKQK